MNLVVTTTILALFVSGATGKQRRNHYIPLPRRINKSALYLIFLSFCLFLDVNSDCLFICSLDVSFSILYYTILHFTIL